MTQEQVAAMMSLEIGTISGYERDHRRPDTEKLSRLARIYGTSTDYLLGNTNDPRPPDPAEDIPSLDSWKQAPDFPAALLLIAEIQDAHGLSPGQAMDMMKQAAEFFNFR
ncbi:MAG: helix-turn-helix domain-containing protein, partial [Thermoplasmatales archaeon]